MQPVLRSVLFSVTCAFILTAEGRGADYIESSSGTVQQGIGCDGCGTQIQRSNYFISEVIPTYSGVLDSMRIRSSNNYAGPTRCFGIIYGDQPSGIGDYLGRSRDSALVSSSLMADRVLHFNAGILLTAGLSYYLGVFTDSANASAMRFAVTSDAVKRTGTTGFDPPHVVVPNYTSAGLAQFENQGVKLLYVTYYYHTEGGTSPPSAPTLSAPANGASGQATSLSLVWNGVQGATSYRLQLSTSSNFATTIIDQASISATSYAVSGLQFSMTYYWRVAAANGSGTSSFSNSWSFSTRSTSGTGMNSLIVSSNGRYLEGGGTPVFLNGEAAWSLIVQPTYAGANQYLTDRATRGVNLVMVNLIEKIYGDHAPANIANVSPWTGSTFSTPNSAYFAHADSIVDRALQLGIYVMIFPVYLGYAFPNGVPSGHSPYEDGWHNEIAAASYATMKNWGTYVGNRYRDYPNVLWCIGGDSDPSSVQAKLDTFVVGLRNADNAYSGRVITGHGGSPLVASSQFPETWLNLNNTYSWGLSDFLTLADQAYSLQPAKPFILLEGVYENNTQISWTYGQLRAQVYWTLLRGGCGHFFGNNPIWYFSASAGGSPTYPWQNDLNSQLTQQIQYLSNFWKSIHWWTLVPDRTSSVITAGAGSGTDLATFASASDSTVIVGYLPSSRTVTINPARVKGDSVRVRWMNTASGQFTALTTFTKAPRSYTPPSSGDWVLVLEGNMTTVVVQPPSAPTLVSPASGATGILTSPTIMWNASANATSYRVQVSTDAAFGSTVVDQSNVSATSLAVSGLANGTVYYWRVSASNSAGTSSYSGVWNFTTTAGSAPPSPSLASPLNGATGVSPSPLLAWNSAVNATSYRLQLATDAAFGSTVYDQSAIAANSVTVGGLAAATTYFWHVNASNSGGTSAYSSTWTFTTSSATGSTYSESTAGTAQQVVGCTECGSQILAANYYLSAIKPTHSGSLDSMRIRASNNYGGPTGCFGILYGDQSNSIGGYISRTRDTAFATSLAMAEFVLHFNGGPTLTAGSTYYLGVFTDSANSTAMRLAYTSDDVSRTGTTGFDPRHLLVQNYTTAGLAQYENQGVKQVYAVYYYHSSSGVSAPPAPTLVSPVNGASGVSTNPTLNWNSASGASTYRLQLSTSSSFGTTVVDRSDLTATSLAVTGLRTRTTYYWRVSAANTGGTSPYSVVQNFHTGKTAATASDTILGDSYASESATPGVFVLEQNYPNPFNPNTSIEYSVPSTSTITLDIFNVLGQPVTTLVDATQAAGNYRVEWNGRDSFGNLVVSGIYFYRLKAGDLVETKKMILLK